MEPVLNAFLKTIATFPAPPLSLAVLLLFHNLHRYTTPMLHRSLQHKLVHQSPRTHHLNKASQQGLLNIKRVRNNTEKLSRIHFLNDTSVCRASCDATADSQRNSSLSIPVHPSRSPHIESPLGEVARKTRNMGVWTPAPLAEPQDNDRQRCQNGSRIQCLTNLQFSAFLR